MLAWFNTSSFSADFLLQLDTKVYHWFTIIDVAVIYVINDFLLKWDVMENVLRNAVALAPPQFHDADAWEQWCDGDPIIFTNNDISIAMTQSSLSSGSASRLSFW